MSRLDSLAFFCRRCVYGEAAKHLLFKVSKQVVMSFCVGVALPDILTCLQKCRSHFCVTGAILLQGFQKITCILGGRHSTFNVPIKLVRGRCSTSDMSCCAFFFGESYCQGCAKWWQCAKSVASVTCCDM